jgi:CheY-like chemotaxis protein
MVEKLSPSRQSTGDSPVGRVRVRVLIADDERIIADTLQMILAEEGLDAVAVYNGKEAIDKARDWKPCIFLSDVIMPEINGIEASIQISAICPKCKVLLFSGRAVVQDLLDEARQKGHNFTVLPKPVHPTALIDCLRSMLNEQGNG